MSRFRGSARFEDFFVVPPTHGRGKHELLSPQFGCSRFRKPVEKMKIPAAHNRWSSEQDKCETRKIKTKKG